MTAEPLLGIDIGGTSIKWVRLAEGGELVGQGSLPTPPNGPAGVIDAVADLCRTLPERSAYPLGVALPGHVDTDTGTTLLVPNLPGDWADHPFGAELAQRVGGPVVLTNDARAFGVAELNLGAVRGDDRAAFLVLGTGIGGAVAVNGRVLRNRTDSVGEFGHSTVVRDGERCGCGNRGCAEAYAGVRAMAHRYLRSGAIGRDERRDNDSVLRLLRNRYDAEDRTARDVVDLAAWAAGCAITNLCVSLRIATVVVGGGLGIHWPEFAAEISRQLVERENLLGPVVVNISTLGKHAGAIGAALSAAPDQFEHHPILEQEFSR